MWKGCLEQKECLWFVKVHLWLHWFLAFWIWSLLIDFKEKLIGEICVTVKLFLWKIWYGRKLPGAWIFGYKYEQICNQSCPSSHSWNILWFLWKKFPLTWKMLVNVLWYFLHSWFVNYLVKKKEKKPKQLLVGGYKVSYKKWYLLCAFDLNMKV